MISVGQQYQIKEGYEARYFEQTGMGSQIKDGDFVVTTSEPVMGFVSVELIDADDITHAGAIIATHWLEG